jgi:hypothetical protein
MSQSSPEVYNGLKELRAKLEHLQLILEQQRIQCSALLGDLASMHQIIRLHGERLEQLNPDAFKELSSVQEKYLELSGKCKPEDIIPREHPLLENLEASARRWQTAIDRLMTAFEFKLYPEATVSYVRSLLVNTEKILATGDIELVYGNLSLVYDHLNRLVMFYEERSERLRNEFLQIRDEVGLYKEQVRSGKVNLDRLRGVINIWLNRIDSLAGQLPSVQPPPPPSPQPPLPPKPLPPAQVQGGLRLSCEGKSFSADLASLHGKALILGRYDPGGLDEDVGSLPDALKVQEYYGEPGRILYLFTNLQCRWGCAKGDEDCTHRHHVLITPDPARNTLRISYFPGAFLPVLYAYSEREAPRRLVGELELKPGQTVYLWISGVRDLVQGKKVPVAISFTSTGRALRDTIAW